MKRLLLFLALFSSSLLILYAFFLEKDEDVVVPPPTVFDEDSTEGGPRAPEPPPPDRSADEATGDSGEGDIEAAASGSADQPSPSEPSPPPIDLQNSPNRDANSREDSPARRGARPHNQPAAGFEATDLEHPIMAEWKNEDGSTREVTAAIIRMGHVKQEKGTNRLVAEGVSFTFFDRTPQEQIVATGTSDSALFFTESEINETLQNIKFRHDCLLKDNVRVKLLGGGGADTAIYSDILLLEENKISAPALGEYSGRVRIVTDTMEVAGTGMEIDLAARSVYFEKDIRIDGTDFSMPTIVDLGAEVDKKQTTAKEPVVITCGGPFLFTSDGRRGGKDSDRSDALIGSGTLSLEGGVTASRAARDLHADTMTMRFDKDGEGRLGLVSLQADSKDDRGTQMGADFGQLFSRSLVWDVTSGAARSRMVGAPVIEKIHFGALPGQPAAAEGLLYRMTARDEISLEMIEGGSGDETGLLLTFVGGGRIEPMPGSGAEDKAFFLEGDAVDFFLVAAPSGDDGAQSEAPAYVPREIRINGRARVQLEGVLEADEIVMTLGTSERGSRLAVTMTRNAVLRHDAFWLESEEILIRVFSDGLTDVSTESGFAMGVSLDAFSGIEAAGAKPLENQITAEGDRTLRLWWPGEEAPRREEGAAASGDRADAERRALKIEGGYTIHVARPGQEAVTITGTERFDMGTGRHEGVQLTTLRLNGSPHIVMSRDGVDEMSLDCGEATVDLDHNAPVARGEAARGETEAAEERDDFGPVLSHRTKPGFFTKSLVRKIVALRDVRLCYGSNVILCDSIDWDLPSDLLVAKGAGEPVRIASGPLRYSGDMIKIEPEKEKFSILNPRVLVPEGP